MCNFSMKTYKETIKTLLAKIKSKVSIPIERKFRIGCEVMVLPEDCDLFLMENSFEEVVAVTRRNI